MNDSSTDPSAYANKEAQAALQEWIKATVRQMVSEVLQGPQEAREGPVAEKLRKETQHEKAVRQRKEGEERRIAHHNRDKERREFRNNDRQFLPADPVAVPENKNVCVMGKGAPLPVTPPVPNFFPSASTGFPGGDNLNLTIYGPENESDEAEIYYWRDGVFIGSLSSLGHTPPSDPEGTLQEGVQGIHFGGSNDLDFDGGGAT